MGKKYTGRARSALSGTPLPVEQRNEGVWIDAHRTLEQNVEVEEAEARWQLWMDSYEIGVLFERNWLLASGCQEEGI